MMTIFLGAPLSVDCSVPKIEYNKKRVPDKIAGTLFLLSFSICTIQLDQSSVLQEQRGENKGHNGHQFDQNIDGRS